MFSEDMSGVELLDEYFNDLRSLQRKTLLFGESGYVRRCLRKFHKQPAVAFIKTFKADGGNSYLGIMMYIPEGIGRSRQWRLNSFHVGLMDTTKGPAAIMFYPESRQALRFTSHFFQRYEERFGRICDWQTHQDFVSAKGFEDIVGIYAKRNLTIAWIETKAVFRNKVHIFSPVNDGVALLQWDKGRKLLQANTFVTMDMLNERQAKMVEYAKIYLSLPMAQRKKFRFPDFILND